MSSVSFVTVLAVNRNDIPMFSAPRVLDVPCEGTIVENDYWLTPIVSKGVLVRYHASIPSPTDGKPTPDSVKATRVKDKNGDVTYILLDDSESKQVFIDNCNACCGATPDMTTFGGVLKTVPTPIVEDAPCGTTTPGSASYKHLIPLPPDPNSFGFTINGVTFNGVIDASLDGVTYANAAAVLAAVQATWSAQGTWSLVNSSKVLELDSTTIKTMSLNLDITPTPYCMTFKASATPVDAISIGGVVVNFPNGAVNSDTANTQQLVDAIKGFFPNGVITVFAASPNKLQIISTGQVPNGLYYQGSAVSGTSFTAGVCA